MKHKLLKTAAVVIVVMIILLVVPTAFAVTGDTGTDGDFDWEELADGTVAVTAYNGAGGAVTVPASLGGKSVSEIKGNVFPGNGAITSVVIEASISELLSNTFAGCSSLESVTLPSSVTKLGGSVFSGCTVLNTLPSIVNVTSIGDAAFAGCSSLTGAVVPAGVTTLGMALFQDCTSLADLEFSCDQPAVPYNIHSIYSGCTSLKNVTFSGDWTTIGSGAFAGYSTLQTVSLPEGMLTIDSGAFYNCTSLSSINIPSTVTTINHQSFYGCTSLPNITLPSGLETLGDGAFEVCTNITQAKIPASVTTLGNGIYASSTSLTDLEFACDQPAGSYSAYSIYHGCPLETVTFSGNWTEIGSGAFAGYTKLESVSLPEGLTTIGAGAFDSCTVLENINIPSTVTQIGGSAFGHCTSLASISFPNRSIIFGGGVFYKCTSLTEVTLPANMTMIGDGMFDDCTALARANFLTTSAAFGSGVFDTTDINSDGMYGFDGSTAQAYALANSHPFHLLQTISFNSQGGSAVGDVYQAAGQTIKEPIEPTKSGYDFEGWYDALDYADKIMFPYIVNGSVTLYAKWDKIYTISFDSQGGSSIADETGITGSTINEPIPTRSGYEFGGWFETSACTGTRVSFPYSIAGDKLMYAKWNKIYTISFDSQGGSSIADETGITGSTINEPIPTRSGYEFGGWFETSACTGTRVSFPYSIAGDKLMYAKWNKIYTISFDSQGGSSVPDETGIFGTTISEPTPTRSGFEFGGWFETSACTGTRVTFPYSIAGDKLLYAKWNKLYNVSFDSQGGSSVADRTGIIGAAISEPTPTRSGYDFSGWFETSACTGTRVSFPYSIAGDKLLYAKWEATPQPTPTPSPTPTNTPVENPQTGKPISTLFTMIFAGAIAVVLFVIIWRSKKTA